MAEPAVRKTPEQEASEKEQARVRLSIGLAQERLKQPQPEPIYSDPFIFRFQKYTNTSFAGLWRLEILNKFGKIEETITDADALPNALEAIGNIFANRGF